ncbi:MAG: polyprenyl synthetase family protein, partial [Methanomassiliicoccales archaeon]|nr:polyprenyl synthetase family protein [Methanomassiliicoccales archaeon]
GGKRIRPGVTLLAHKAVGGKDDERVINIAASFELIHSATLIHDDINDLGEIRRGREAAYRKYGVQKALIAGDFLFVRSFRLGGIWDTRVVQIVADAATAIAESEILQSSHEFDPSVSQKTCEKIIEGKTAKIIEAAAMVGSHLGEGSEEQVQMLGRYGLNLGMAFQIIDDILDIDGNESQLGKSRGVDFIDGKPTLPLMFAMQDPRSGGELARTFVKQKKTKREVEEALQLVRRTDAIARSHQVAEEFRGKALRALDGLADSIYKESLIQLAGMVVDRKT